MTSKDEATAAGWSRQRGIALVAVIWLLVLLALLAANFTRTTRASSYLARNLVAGAEARALADAGIHRAVAGLYERNVERRLALNGTPYELALAGGRVRISLQDEGGKFDLNRTPESMLTALFFAAGLGADEAQALAAAVADYRDADDDRRPNGAEAPAYRAAGLDRGPRNGRFEAIEELRQVLGVSDSLYREVAPAVTVYGRGRRVNRETAPELVLRALLADDAAAAVQQARGGIVRRLDALEEQGDAEDTDADADTPERRRSRPRRVGAVTVTAHAESATGGVFARQAIVRLSGRRTSRDVHPPFDVLAWREGETQTEPAPDPAAE